MDTTNTIKDKLIEALKQFSIECWLYETALRDIPGRSSDVQRLFETLSDVTTNAWEEIEQSGETSAVRMLTDITELLENRRTFSSKEAQNVLEKHVDMGDVKPSYNRQKLDLIEGHIRKFMGRIKATSNVDDSFEYFQALERLQRLIAKMSFGEKIEISESLYKFVYDFDRVDDPVIRNSLYKRIREHEYDYAL